MAQRTLFQPGHDRGPAAAGPRCGQPGPGPAAATARAQARSCRATAAEAPMPAWKRALQLAERLQRGRGSVHPAPTPAPTHAPTPASAPAPTPAPEASTAKAPDDATVANGHEASEPQAKAAGGAAAGASWWPRVAA